MNTSIMLNKIFANNFSSIYYHVNMLILEKPRYIFWCERREKTLYIFNFYTTCQVAKSKYWTLHFGHQKYIYIHRKRKEGTRSERETTVPWKSVSYIIIFELKMVYDILLHISKDFNINKLIILCIKST